MLKFLSRCKSTGFNKYFSTMTVRFIIPLENLPYIQNGQVADILIEPGQKIKKGELVMIIDTAKASMTESAIVSGTIKNIFVKKDQLIENKASLYEIEV